MAPATDVPTLLIAADAAAIANDVASATRLYEALRPFERERVGGYEARSDGPSVAYHLGVLARTIGRFEAAEAHLRRALAVHADAGDEGWSARVRCERARVLLARGDADGPRAALAELNALPACIDGTALADEAAGLRSRAWGAASGACNVFRHQGDVWTIAFGGHISHLRDAKGMHWLAMLLREPGRRFPVLALETIGAASEPAAGVKLDPRARERARVRVTRALRSALSRIDANHPVLGQHLADTVRTGHTCAYLPDSRLAIEWTS